MTAQIIDLLAEWSHRTLANDIRNKILEFGLDDDAAKLLAAHYMALDNDLKTAFRERGLNALLGKACAKYIILATTVYRHDKALFDELFYIPEDVV